MQSFYHEGQVEVDGETLTLVCDFGAIMAIESVTGENWDDIVPQLAAPSRTLSVQVLWGLLRRKHEGITLDQAAGVAFGDEQAKVGQCMFEVIARACNIADDEKSDEPAKKKQSGQQPTLENAG
jgi:hypothetical protein